MSRLFCNNIIGVISVVGLSLICQLSSAQSPIKKYTLDEIAQIANGNSLSSAQYQRDYDISILDYQLIKSNAKPNIFFNGSIPGYIRSSQEIVQPDGSIKFQSVRYNNSSARLIGTQNLTSTGGTFRVISDLQRFDDIGRNTKIFNGVPIRFGFNQPLFSFNEIKWDNTLSEYRKREAEMSYQASLAEDLVTLNGLFFDLALAESNLIRAYQNLSNTDTMFAIAQERFELGRLSKHDLLQLNLEKVNAAQSVSVLINNVAKAIRIIDEFSGFKLADTFSIQLPTVIPNIIISYEEALQHAMANRPEPAAYLRALKESERELELQKKSNGLNANLDVSFGFARGAETLSEIYQNTPQEQSLSLSFSVPIADFGRSKYRILREQEKYIYTEFEIVQLQLRFESNLKLLIDQFYRFKDALELSKEADGIAAERYSIAQKRYVFRDINILDLSFSQREKDAAKQTYISSMANFWNTYYQIQALSLYDFIHHKKLVYATNI